MKKLNSFAEFSAAKHEKDTVALEKKQNAKRSNEADLFKELLSEYGVTRIKELEEEKRFEFFDKLKNLGLNESILLLTEATRGHFGKIDKRGNIESVYTHADSYPEAMLPLIKMTYLKGGSPLNMVLKNGGSSGLEEDPRYMNYYGDMENQKGKIKNMSKYLEDIGWAEYVYLFDERDGKWYMLHVDGNAELVPAFESLAVNESTRSQIGILSKSGKITSTYVHSDGYPEHMLPMLKGYSESDIKQLMKLGKAGISFLDKSIGKKHSFSNPTRGYTIFYGRDRGESGDMQTTGQYKKVDQYLNDVSNGAGAEWVYLWDEENKNWLVADIYGDKELMPSSTFESVVNETSLSGIEFGNDDDIHPTKFKPLTTSLKKNKVKMKVQKEEGDHGYPEVKLTGKREDIEKVLADVWGPDSISDYEDYFESVVNESEAENILQDLLDERGGDMGELHGMEMEDALDTVESYGHKGSKAKKIAQELVSMCNESVVNEAIKVDGKRDAKKVVTQYKKIFYKTLPDFGAMSHESIRGCVKYLFEEAMTDANFHREKIVSRNIKGKMAALEIKLPGLGGHFVKLGTTTLKRILDKYYSDIANAAGWSGQGIVEGTALFLQELKEERMGQSLLDDFNSLFESVNEAEIKSEEDFKEYAYEVLQKAFGEEFDEAKADEVVAGILKKCDGDYGKCAGILQSSLA
jgi:hypothetical protein